jgi:selenocysteine lyase/cysteine desulfurase
MIGIALNEEKVNTLGNKLKENNVYVGFRGASMRVAPYLYNDEEDVKNLFRLL